MYLLVAGIHTHIVVLSVSFLLGPADEISIFVGSETSAGSMLQKKRRDLDEARRLFIGKVVCVFLLVATAM